MTTIAPLLLEKLDGLPRAPGVYLFRDRTGVVVYIGKAKNLRARVRSYFQDGSSDTRYFIPILHRTAVDVDTRVTASEKEALLLENVLVKEHKPRFNVKLRDDKTYLSLRLDLHASWPRLEVVRRPTADGAKYFGPYHSASSARRTLNVINKHFQLRTCTDTEFRARTRPCLQHQIKRCAAPCVYEVDREWYSAQAQHVGLFLGGKHADLATTLTSKMHDSARAMQFELAAAYRDQLRAIESVQERQRVAQVDTIDRDVIGLYREADLAELAVVYMRQGRIADVATYTLRNVATLDDELLSAFIANHYAPADDGGGLPMPDEILLGHDLEAETGLEEYLREVRNCKVHIKTPQRGSKVDLVALADENAKHAFAEKRRVASDIDERLATLKERLGLPSIPLRIECCDISHLGGGDTVGAVVALLRGEPDKARYRSFRVEHTQSVAGDDYGAMYEVLARRFRRGLAARSDKATHAGTASAPTDGVDINEVDASDAEDSAWDLPDLFVVDGGRGQLGVALAAARDLGVFDLPIVGIAKEKESVTGETLVERIYLPGQKNPIAVRSSAALLLLAKVRDEAHRFSNKIRARVGGKRRLVSTLDSVPGLGPSKRKLLLETFGSVAGIQAASDAQLLAVPGVGPAMVGTLRSHLQSAAQLSAAAQSGATEPLP
jgi:excinuclease ABC subunit C